LRIQLVVISKGKMIAVTIGISYIII